MTTLKQAILIAEKLLKQELPDTRERQWTLGDPISFEIGWYFYHQMQVAPDAEPKSLMMPWGVFVRKTDGKAWMPYNGEYFQIFVNQQTVDRLFEMITQEGQNITLDNLPEDMTDSWEDEEINAFLTLFEKIDWATVRITQLKQALWDCLPSIQFSDNQHTN